MLSTRDHGQLAHPGSNVPDASIMEMAQKAIVQVRGMQDRYTAENLEKARAAEKRKREIIQSKQFDLVALGLMPFSGNGSGLKSEIEDMVTTRKIVIEDMERKRENNDFAYKMIFGSDHDWRYKHLILMIETWLFRQQGSHEWLTSQSGDVASSFSVEKNIVYDHLVRMILPENWQSQDFIRRWKDRVSGTIEYAKQMKDSSYNYSQALQNLVETEITIKKPSVPSNFKKAIEDLLFMGSLCFMDDVFEFHLGAKEASLSFPNPDLFEIFIRGNAYTHKAVKSHQNHIIEPTSMRNAFNAFISGSKKNNETIMRSFYNTLRHARCFMIQAGYYRPDRPSRKRMRPKTAEDVSFVHSKTN